MEDLQKTYQTPVGLEAPATPSICLGEAVEVVVVEAVEEVEVNPNDQNHGPKLSGKEPVIFNGDCPKAEAFILEWTIYLMLNEDTEVMSQAFSRTMLFLTFIKGPNVQEWVGLQGGWLGRCLHTGAGRNEEYLYDTVMDSFNTAFTNSMSMQKAKAEFQTIKMEGGDLDTYIAKFKRLTRLAGYNLQAK